MPERYTIRGQVIESPPQDIAEVYDKAEARVLKEGYRATIGDGVGLWIEDEHGEDIDA